MAEHILTRRQVLVAGAAAGALALTGCGGRGGGSRPAGAGAPTDESTPQRGGELRIPLTQEPIAPAFDMGTRAAGSVGTAAISTLAYNGLVEVVDGEVVPQLALSWEQPEPTRYVLELRTDVEFHDGTPFDAAAVKANFDRRMAPGSDAVNLPPFLESVAVLGSHQVEFTLAQPAAAFLASLRRGRMMMMSPTAVEAYADSDPFKASVGTGPYAFREYRPGDRIGLERFDGYWAETNYLDAITFTIIPTTSTQIQAFLNGEFDLISVVPAQVNQLTRDPDVVIHEFVGNTFNYLTFNQGRAPFDDPDVRRAFSAALDREGIAQGVYNGYAEPASGPFSPAIGDAYQDLSDVVAQSYAPDEARELLRKAGFDTGTAVRFDSFTQAPWGSEADAMEAQLEEIGLDIQLEKQDFGSWADLIYTARDFTMFNSGQTTRTVDPDEVIYPLAHSTGDLNVFGLADPELDALLDQARAEGDPGVRAELYHDIARNVAENAHAAFTVWPKEIMAAGSKLKGLTFYAGGTHAAEGCWLSS